MPIRYVDRRAYLGRLQVTLDDAAALWQGTHVRPAGRTGVIASQLDPATASIVGGFTVSSNRTGVIATTLDGVTASLVGTFLQNAGPVSNSPTINLDLLPTENADGTPLTDLAFVVLWKNTINDFASATQFPPMLPNVGSYTDPAPGTGTRFYWWQAIDSDGTPSDPSVVIVRNFP